MLGIFFDKLQLEQKIEEGQIFHDIFLRPPLTINSLVGWPWWFIISSSHPAQAFLSPQMRMAPLSKFHAIFTITGFSDWCHLLKQSHASISAQLLSVGNEKALINHCMVINVRLRKHFQMQIWPKRWGKPVMNLLDIFRIKIENGILTPLPYPLKQDKALCRFLCQIYQTFLIFQIN